MSHLQIFLSMRYWEFVVPALLDLCLLFTVLGVHPLIMLLSIFGALTQKNKRRKMHDKAMC